MLAQVVQIDQSDLFWGIIGPGMFCVLVSYLLGLVVFAPLNARAAWEPPKTRFRIADIFVLLVQLQIAAGILFALGPLLEALHTAWSVTLVLLAWSLLGFWWWTGVRMLAKARIDRGSDRLLFLAIMLPLGYLASLGALLTPVLVILSIGAAYWLITHPTWYEAIIFFGLLDTIAVVFAGGFLVRWYCRRIADRARDDVARDDGIEFDALSVRKQAKPGSFPPMASDREVQILSESKPPEASLEE